MCCHLHLLSVSVLYNCLRGGPLAELGLQMSGVCGVCICCFYLLLEEEDEEGEGGGEGGEEKKEKSNNPNLKGREQPFKYLFNLLIH